ncbi:MAG TPA: hypothetical protein IAC31_02190 [Candidatus Faecousia intestinigallinarum]|nr:hypothetical protein [Candidatus Faecousia intestinigallinarum]
MYATKKSPSFLPQAGGNPYPGAYPQVGPAVQNFAPAIPAYSAAQKPVYQNTVPSNPTAAPAPPSPPQEQSQAAFISPKIYKINGKDKVIDFSSKLVVARMADYANIHGCGGKEHSANSTIQVTICDYSKGTGEQSVTARCNLDVEVFATLYQAAIDARLGKFSTRKTSGLSDAVMAAVNMLRKWTNAPECGNGVKAIPFAEIAAAEQYLQNATRQDAAGKPFFEYMTEKNNPYRKDRSGNVPVSKLYVAYMPLRNTGEVSRYPWLVQIQNFMAPLKQKANGSTAHDASKAFNTVTASINLSADDFAAAMVAVERFVRLWEMANALPVIRTAQAAIERKRQEVANK